VRRWTRPNKTVPPSIVEEVTMNRLKIVVATLGALALLVRLARGRSAALIEHMIEDVMPRMMDRCFSEMDAERRQFMLAHCRGMLDEVEAKYVESEPPSASEPASASQPADAPR
jgi:hypothetical protein